MTDLCIEVNSIEDIRKKLVGKPKNGQQSLEFLPVLHHFSHGQATKDLDKVYALLGLFKEDMRPCKATYDDMTKNTLNRELSLYFLLNSTKNPFQALYGKSTFPVVGGSSRSWQVDFTRVTKKSHQSLEAHRTELRRDYKAAEVKTTKVTAIDEPNPKKLAVNGFEIDQVDRVSEEFRSSSSSERKKFCLSCSEDIKYKHRKTFVYPSDRSSKETSVKSLLSWGSSKTVGEAFSRLVLGNRCINRSGPNTLRRPHTEDLASIESWLFSPNGTLKDDLMLHVKCSLWKRKFFTTKGGLMGFGPSKMQKGDEVWLIYGDRVPFILRPLEKTDGLQEHGIVGDCYLQGIMEEEATKNATKMKLLLK